MGMTCAAGTLPPVGYEEAVPLASCPVLWVMRTQGTALSRTALPKIFFLPPQFSFFLPLFAVSSCGFLVVFLKVSTLKCAVLGPPGLHTTARELQTCTFQGPGPSKHHQNSTRRHQKREDKMKIVAGEGKKREMLGLPPFGGPPFGAPPFGCLFFHALFFHLVVLFC